MVLLLRMPVVPVQAEELPKNHIKFAVCGMSHDHIYGMIGAIQRAAANWWLPGRGAGQDCHFQEAFSQCENGGHAR